MRRITVLLPLTVFLCAFAFAGAAFAQSYEEDDSLPILLDDGTIKAPFIQPVEPQKGKSFWGSLFRSGGTAADLSQPHRHKDQVAQWAAETVAQALSLDMLKYEEQHAALEELLTPAGLTAYEGFLEKNRILEVLQSNDMVVNSYVESFPVLTRSGAVEGYYRWRFEVPVTMTYLARSQVGVTGAAAVNRRMTVIVQVVHVGEGYGYDGMMIEGWNVAAAKK